MIVSSLCILCTILPLNASAMLSLLYLQLNDSMLFKFLVCQKKFKPGYHPAIEIKILQGLLQGLNFFFGRKFIGVP